MKTICFIALAIIGNGVYLLVQGKPMEGLGTIMFAVFGLVFLLVYQQTERSNEVKRKSRGLSRPRPSRRPPR